MSTYTKFKLYSFRAIGKGTYLRCSMPGSRLVIWNERIEFIWTVANIEITKDKIEGIYSSWLGFTIELKDHEFELVDFTSYFKGKKIISTLNDYGYLINQKKAQ